MKSLLSVLAVSAALGFALGCGPQEAFCPNTSAADAGGVCPINGDDAQVKPKDMGGGLCGPGQFLGDDPNNPGNQICLCASTSQPPPC